MKRVPQHVKGLWHQLHRIQRNITCERIGGQSLNKWSLNLSYCRRPKANKRVGLCVYFLQHWHTTSMLAINIEVYKPKSDFGLALYLQCTHNCNPCPSRPASLPPPQVCEVVVHCCNPTRPTDIDSPAAIAPPQRDRHRTTGQSYFPILNNRLSQCGVSYFVEVREIHGPKL